RLDVPKELQVDAIGKVAKFAAELGKDDLAQRAMSRVTEIASGDEKLAELRDKYAKRVEAGSEIRKRLIDVSLCGKSANVIRDGLDRVKEFRRFVSQEREDTSSMTEHWKEEPISSL